MPTQPNTFVERKIEEFLNSNTAIFYPGSQKAWEYTKEEIVQFMRQALEEALREGRREALKCIYDTEKLDQFCKCEDKYLVSFMRKDYDKLLDDILPKQ